MRNLKLKVFSKVTTKPAFKIFFWIAGSLTPDKFTEMKIIILNNDFEIMGIVEKGATADNEEYFNIPGYWKFELKHSRQIACGINVFVKLSLKAKLVASCQMTAKNKLEYMKMHAWRQET